VVCEVSTLADARPDNGIHVLDARDGRQVWERVYEPGQNHWQQGRALQTDSRLWILTNGLWEGLDPLTGSLVQSFKAGANHCFPPLATTRFLVGSEMGFTDMVTGVVDANRITKQACSRDAGVILANGLVYAAPKHCSCYPMLKSYSALAPAKPSPGPAAKAPEPADFVAERGPAYGEPAPASAAASSAAEWPCYRADAWRSASAASAPAGLDVLWTAELGDWPAGPRVQDWKENVYARGPVTPPVVAGGMAFVAQPDGHRVVAFDAGTGKVRWDFTANGRIDTPPTINGGLCLFGTRSGTVYALRAADGKLAWRLRAGPDDERIISFGQLESPWPVPGSVLVVGDTAYFAAGRHPLADGGIRLFAVDPARGTVKWVKTLVSLPMKDYYGGAALEFDPFDLLVAEEKRPVAGGATGAADGRPDFITMSRWQIDPATGDMGVAWESGFGYYRTGPGAGGVMAARSVWTYGQRMDYLASGAKPGVPDTVGAKLRPLAAFRGSTLAASTDDGRRLFLREFTPESAAAFNDKWYSQRQLPKKKDAPGDRDRHERLSHEAKWTVDVFDAAERDQRIAAVVLAGDTVYVAGPKGRLLAFAAADGRKLAQCDLSAALWDGVAAAYGHLFISTQSGGLVCLGKK
jgi:outer membrane protein assembly factor BamB